MAITFKDYIDFAEANVGALHVQEEEVSVVDLVPVLDEEGNPVLDEDENQVMEEKKKKVNFLYKLQAGGAIAKVPVDVKELDDQEQFHQKKLSEIQKEKAEVAKIVNPA